MVSATEAMAVRKPCCSLRAAAGSRVNSSSTTNALCFRAEHLSVLGRKRRLEANCHGVSSAALGVVSDILPAALRSVSALLTKCEYAHPIPAAIGALGPGPQTGEMQTYLPFPDFQQSAAVLDRVRLGKQRVEALQILRALVIPEYGWQSHPAVRMWMGYVPALTLYGLSMVDEWTARGGEDTTREKIMEFAPAGRAPGLCRQDPDAAVAGRSRSAPQPPLPADRQGSAVLHAAVPGHGTGP